MIVRRFKYKHQILLAALAMLALRALTPEGYMPAAQGSGLLFELCPEGVPVEVMRALSGGGHHHHHGASGPRDSGAGTSDCPIGHMLSSAVAHDADGVSDITPDLPTWTVAGVRPAQGRRHPIYHPRAPPA